MATKPPPKPLFVNYNIRGLRADLRERWRVEALLRNTSMERLANRIVGAGLAALETERLGAESDDDGLEVT